VHYSLKCLRRIKQNIRDDENKKRSLLCGTFNISDVEVRFDEDGVILESLYKDVVLNDVDE
jgi:hypothetical protein